MFTGSVKSARFFLFFCTFFIHFSAILALFDVFMKKKFILFSRSNNRRGIFQLMNTKKRKTDVGIVDVTLFNSRLGKSVK